MQWTSHILSATKLWSGEVKKSYGLFKVFPSGRSCFQPHFWSVSFGNLEILNLWNNLFCSEAIMAYLQVRRSLNTGAHERQMGAPVPIYFLPDSNNRLVSEFHWIIQNISNDRLENILAFVAMQGWVYKAYNYIFGVSYYSHDQSGDELPVAGTQKQAIVSIVSIPITFFIAFTLYPLFCQLYLG